MRMHEEESQNSALLIPSETKDSNPTSPSEGLNFFLKQLIGPHLIILSAVLLAKWKTYLDLEVI